MKKLIGSLTLSAALVLPAVGVSAASSDGITGGEVNLDSNRDVVTPYTTEYVGGGTWQHGFSGSLVYSYYNHTSKTHRASVENYNTVKRDVWRSSSYGYSRVTLPQTLWGNKAYWNTK